MPGVECVSEPDLQAFLLGRLPERVGQCISAHLESCAECEAMASRLDLRTDPLVTAIRRAASPDAPLAAAPQGPGEVAWVPSDETAAAILLPQSVGGYELLEEIGRGGMSVVYRGRQAHPDRVVALKMILAGAHAGQARRTRLLAEADAIARLRHPNVVQIYEVGQHEGLPFLALEYADGGSLAQHLAGKPQPPRAAAALVEVLARTVHQAHALGIIHRDLKPANVLLTGDGVLKISDFGLAKSLAREPHLTSTQAILGTPSYMAPEQAGGKTREIGPLVDVYALGAILYECLTGRPPFQAGSALETLQQVVEREPTPPSLLQRGLPRDLETCCLKCMEKEPGRRYASAAELAEDLRRFQAGESVLARPLGTPGRLWRWARRNPGWAAMLAAVSALLVSIAASTSLLSVWALRAEYRTRKELFESRLAEARATSLSRRHGQRFASLALLDEARSLARQLRLPPERFHDLRNATVAALALPDIYPEELRESLPKGTRYVDFDDRLEIYAFADRDGNCHIRRVEDDSEVGFLPAPRTGADRPSLGVASSVDSMSARESPGASATTVSPAPAGTETGQVRQFCPLLSRNAGFLALYEPGARADVWRLGSGSPTVVLTEKNVASVDLRPDSSQVAFGHADGAISVYDLPTARLINRLPPDNLIRDIVVALHPTEPIVAVASYFANVVQVRDLRTAKVIQSLSLPGGGYHVAWDPTGRTLAASEGDRGAIHLYDRATFAHREIASPGSGARLFFNHGGDRLACHTWSEMVHICDVNTGRVVFSASCGSSALVLRFDRNDHRLAGMVIGQRVAVWHVADGREYRTLAQASGQGSAYGPSISVYGQVMAQTFRDGVGFWDLQTGAWIGMLPLPEPRFVRFSPRPELSVVIGDGHGTAHWPIRSDPVAGVWHIGPPRPLRLPPGPDMSLSEDGAVLVSGFRAVGVFQPWAGGWVLHDDPPGALLHVDAGTDIGGVDVSPDGRWVVTTRRIEGPARVWDARTGALLRTLPGAGAHPHFSPNGRWLALGGPDGVLLEVGTWDPAGHFGGEGSFTPDNRLLVRAAGQAGILGPGEMHILRLIDPQRGRELVRFTAPDSEAPDAVSFTPDGGTLIVENPTGSVSVWDLRLLRAELARRSLDWDAPPVPPPSPTQVPRRIEVDRGDYERMARDQQAKNFDEAVAAAPHLSVRWYLRARFHRQAGRHADALRDLRKAHELEPARASYCAALARLYATAPGSLRKATAAVGLAARAIELQPGQWTYYNTLGIACYRAGRINDAVAALERSLNHSAGQTDGFDLYFLALCHRRLGDSARGRDCFRRAAAWHDAHKNLEPEEAQELAAFRAEAAASIETSSTEGQGQLRVR